MVSSIEYICFLVKYLIGFFHERSDFSSPCLKAGVSEIAVSDELEEMRRSVGNEILEEYVVRVNKEEFDEYLTLPMAKARGFSGYQL